MKKETIKYIYTNITTMIIIFAIGSIVMYIFGLEKDIRTLQHEVNYMKHRIDVLEENN